MLNFNDHSNSRDKINITPILKTTSTPMESYQIQVKNFDRRYNMVTPVSTSQLPALQNIRNSLADPKEDLEFLAIGLRKS